MLGTVDISNGDIEIDIDTNFETSKSDILGATSIITSSSTHSIIIDEINILANPTSSDISVKVADDVTKAHISFASRIIDIGQGGGQFRIVYDRQTGNIVGAHADLTNAIISDVETKLYSMDRDETIDNMIALNGISLTVEGNDKTIFSSLPNFFMTAIQT